MLLAIEIIVMKSTVHSSAGGKTPNNIIIDIRYASYRENMKFPIHSFTTRYVYGEKPRFWEKLNIQQQQPGHHDTKLKTETQKVIAAATTCSFKMRTVFDDDTRRY